MEPTAELGADLAALVRDVGSPLVEVTALSRRRADGSPAAFRLRFADGTALKGSRTERPDIAAAVVALATRLNTLAPRVIGTRGAAILSEWVEGVSLAGTDCSDALLRRCGAAQAQVHAQPVAGDDPRQQLQYWHRVMRWTVKELVAAGLLAADEQRRLRALRERYAPTNCTAGLTLGDFCDENIVCRTDGEPCLIDIETLALAPYDYDLGRTWYRWPMRPAQRAAYLEGYRAHRDPATFLAHEPFWRMVALVEGAYYRFRQKRPDVDVPIGGLRELLAGEAAAVSP